MSTEPSYRRQDSSAASRWLAETLIETFGATSVFIDSDAIHVGDEWPAKIESALRNATVLIAVIGPSWLRLADEFGRRRIDRTEDWVRSEIKYAIDNGLAIIPLLVARAVLPPSVALPDILGPLTRHQTFELRDMQWDNDINVLLSQLQQLGFRPIRRTVIYPRPHVRPEPLTPTEIALAISRGWECVVSSVPGEKPHKRTELMRAYELASFEVAIQFMVEASSFISAINHHPRWENLWRTVTVWLTTWDIGHNPSKYDLELTEYLDGLFLRYPKPPAGS